MKRIKTVASPYGKARVVMGHGGDATLYVLHSKSARGYALCDSQHLRLEGLRAIPRQGYHYGCVWFPTLKSLDDAINHHLNSLGVTHSSSSLQPSSTPGATMKKSLPDGLYPESAQDNLAEVQS